MKKKKSNKNVILTKDCNSSSCIKCDTIFPSDRYQHFRGWNGLNCMVIGDYTAISKEKINVR